MSDECEGHTDSDISTYVVSKDEDGRDVIRYFFRGYINDESVSPLIETMYYWDAHYPESRWEIDINSGGGEIYPAIALYGAVSKYSERRGGKHHITTRVAGLAASGGELLLQAGDHRVGGAMDMIMIHGPLSSRVDSPLFEIRADLGRGEEWMRRLALVHCERSPMGVDDFLKAIEVHRDWYLYADQAWELGFLDEVLL
ncbi:ClpP-like protease [Mycobacterium phage Aziz]|uniref:ClpP-like protease n=1 Tax=Mycobacterium phage Aziz TaxID=2762281 RepID=A0A7G8LHK2_9CAUD|nr:ClpP-like protease [Mycobacterium phage Aziz]ASR75911.1 ClpP-like protease [Mycobacterium phage GenevaB15]QNJ56724.1 ClpP-like protease [Mycobacterium phage Aziz]